MRLFLLGAPCAGKTTLTGRLRRALPCPVLDMDEEFLSEASLLDDVVLAYSLLFDDALALLEAHDWCVALLDLPESVMRERAASRQRQEGWSNVQWLPFHLEHIAQLRRRRVFSQVLDATRPPPAVAEAVAGLMGSRSVQSCTMPWTPPSSGSSPPAR